MSGSAFHNLEIAASGAVLVTYCAGLFFWGRGIVNCRRSDLIAGPAILATLATILLAISNNSSVFSGIGGGLLGFGVATFLISPRDAKTTCPLPKNIRQVIGGISVVCGLVLMTII